MLFREIMAVYCAHHKENLRLNKIKFTQEQTMKAQGGSRGFSSTLSLTSALGEGGCSMPHPGRFTPTKETRYLIAQEAGGSQGKSGRVRKISPHGGIRFPDLPARNESL
jgi:hypothetical protein